MPTYREDLKDLRWIERAKEVRRAAGMRCQKCGATNVQLHVHHLYYERGKRPWEYPDRALQALCRECHEEATYEQGLAASEATAPAIKEAIENKGRIQQILTGFAIKLAMPGKPKPPPRRPTEPEVWETIKALGDAKSRPMMACLVKLYQRGWTEPAILNCAIHYAKHHEQVRNPFAYYTATGAAAIAQLVAAQDEEHEKLKRAPM